MMPVTFNDMVVDIQSMLFGFVRTQEQSTYLTADMDTTTGAQTVISVNDPTQISRGLIEIDDELLWVQSSDRNANSGQVISPPYGRGYMGTTVASHLSGAKVTYAPLFPRSRVKRAINDTILAVSNDLFSVGTHTFTFTPAVVTYALPADVRDVLAVSYDTIGPSQMWYPLTRWRFDPMANAGDFAAGKTIDIYESVTPGRNIQVKYFKYPSELSANSDLFTATGLLESSRDCITYGAASRLVSSTDASILNTQAVEANALDDRAQPGSWSALARSLYQLHKQRLMEERLRYLQQYPTKIHRPR